MTPSVLHRVSRWFSLVALAAGACVGDIDEPGSPGAASTAGANASGTSNAGSASGAPEPGKGVVAPTAACATRTPDPGATVIRRLTNAEYQRSTKDLLGIDVGPQVVTFPTDLVLGGFENQAATQSLSSLHLERYRAAAEDLAAQALGAATRTKVMGCDVTQGDRSVCLRSFIEKFGRRAFRRLLTNTEVTRLLALADTDPDPVGAAQLVLQAILQSPNFLFRPEVGLAEAGRTGQLRLTGFEVATRLSYFLTGTTPDDGLLDAAAAGQLDTAAGVEAVTRKLLAEPRTRTAMGRFLDQWFAFEKLPAAARDAKTYPLYSPALLTSMAEELRRLFDEHVWKDSASFLDLYTTRRGFVDTRLAKVYGVTAPSATAMAPIDFGAAPDRGGLLATAALLTVTVKGNSTSPILRGKYVRETVLCDPPPPPPPNVPSLEPKQGENAADAEERHASDPTCAACHSRIDPIGHGLERYDAIGALRASYPGGKPVRQTGLLDGVSFGGGAELGKLVKDAPLGQMCAVAKTFEYALGRHDDPKADACTMSLLGADFRSAGFNYPRLVSSFTKSDAFRYRLAHTP